MLCSFNMITSRLSSSFKIKNFKKQKKLKTRPVFLSFRFADVLRAENSSFVFRSSNRFESEDETRTSFVTFLSKRANGEEGRRHNSVGGFHRSSRGENARTALHAGRKRTMSTETNRRDRPRRSFSNERRAAECGECLRELFCGADDRQTRLANG